MSTSSAFSIDLREGRFDESLSAVYGNELHSQRGRLATLVERFRLHFAAEPTAIFSAPGRTELGGNHTDHNAGRVLAASVSLDTVAAAAPRTDRTVRLISEGFSDAVEVDLRGTEPVSGERETPAALIRGVCADLSAHGYRSGGFDAYVSSEVQPGSGLSSSAAFEVLLATIVSYFYNDGAVSVVDRARAGRRAENEFFGKPSGLMDQIACAAGGVVAIDFETDVPHLEQVAVDFEAHGYRLCAVHTGGSHVDLTHAYADVVTEMKAVAVALGGATLREVSLDALLARLPEVRAETGDRAVLRALHFFGENDRVVRQTRLLEAGDVDGYLSEVRSSGSSSWRLLQNCYPPGAAAHQDLALALAVSHAVLGDGDGAADGDGAGRGAARVHGGGFAGAIQAYVPLVRAREYRDAMVRVFGERAVTELGVRSVGATQVCSVSG